MTANIQTRCHWSKEANEIGPPESCGATRAEEEQQTLDQGSGLTLAGHMFLLKFLKAVWGFRAAADGPSPFVVDLRAAFARRRRDSHLVAFDFRARFFE